MQGRLGKRLLVGGAAALVTSAVAALLLLFLLPKLVEGWAQAQLQARGLGNLSFRVTSIGWREARIEDVELPGAAKLSLPSLEVTYGWNGLTPRITAVLIEHARIEFQADTPLQQAIASLGDSFSAPAAGGGALRMPNLPPIEIRDGEMVLPAAAGPPATRLGFSGRLDPAGDDRYALDFIVSGRGPLGQIAGRADGSLDLTGSGAMRLSFADGELAAPGGRMEAEGLEGEAYLSLVAFQPWAATANLAASKVTVPGLPAARLRLALDRDPDRTLLTAEAVGLDGSFRARGTGTLQIDAPAPSAEGELSLEADGASPLWKALGLPPPASGRTQISGPATVTLSRPPNADASFSIVSRATASLDLRLDDVAWPGVADGVSGGGRLELIVGAGGVLSVQTPAALSLKARIAPDLLDAMKLPAAMRGTLDRPVAFELSAPTGLAIQPQPDGSRHFAGEARLSLLGDRSLSLRLGGTANIGNGRGLTGFDLPAIEAEAQGWPVETAGARFRMDRVALTGSLSGTPANFSGKLRIVSQLIDFSYSRAQARNLSFDLKNDLQFFENKLVLSLQQPGSARIDKLALPHGIVIRGPGAFALRPAKQVPLLVATFAPGGATVDYGVRTGPLDLTWQSAPATEPGPVRLHLGAAGFYGHWSAAEGASGEVRLADARAELPEHGMVAENADARFTYSADGNGKLIATVAHVRLGADRNWLPPLALDGKASLRRGAIEFDLAARDERNWLRLDFSGIHDLTHGRGAGRIQMAPIRFLPGGLQPRDLFPALGPEIDEATGTVSLGGAMAWKGGAVFSDLALKVQDLTVAGPDIELGRVNGAIALKSLSPLATQPDQQIAIGQIKLGVPMTDGLVTFRIAPGPILEISQASLKLARGSVRVGPTRLDPAAASQQVMLAVSGVDLGELLALAEIDGLTATGRLDGRIPVTVAGNDVTIRGAMLESTQPGLLAYSPTAPPPGLQGGGETVSLVLSALADFRYDRLWLTLDRDARGEASVGLHVRGNNPGFYDGYPIEFNLALEGKLDRILRDSLQGYRVPDWVRDKLARSP
ncbi:MAG: intermembrane phospholipid transport protein YdbH family protein [Pseudomonadota bacterium]